jgi:hypothetical protein
MMPAASVWRALSYRANLSMCYRSVFGDWWLTPADWQYLSKFMRRVP